MALTAHDGARGSDGSNVRGAVISHHGQYAKGLLALSLVAVAALALYGTLCWSRRYLRSTSARRRDPGLHQPRRQFQDQEDLPPPLHDKKLESPAGRQVASPGSCGAGARVCSPVLGEKRSVGSDETFLNPSPWTANGTSLPWALMSRLPVPPPLIPPELSTSIFTYDGHGRIRGDRDSFLHQPNPDYLAASPRTSPQTLASDSPLTTRRRSYNMMLPMTTPLSTPSRSGPGHAGQDPALPSFHPVKSASLASASPSSLSLPSLPPSSSSSGSAAQEGERSWEIGVRGEIISVLNENGAGWTRHSRVYGSQDICPACAASYGGGFYGATVPPEDMRGRRLLA